MELFGSTSHRGFSVRSIFTSVLVVVVTALLWVLFASATPVNAEDQPILPATDASWSGERIIHAGHSYVKANPSTLDPSHGIAKDSTIYIFRESASGTSSSRKAFIIYFAPGVDPPTAEKAEYVEYTYSTSGVFSSPQNKKTITIAPPGEESMLSSCSVDGIGWLLCPISTFLAEAMDWLFGILATLIAVQPPTLGDPNNDLFRAWSVMRNIANVAFVIAFIIIIYSQLTSVGLSNYGLKKLIPRLIIAAILVNMSFIITALAIDISNILGYSLQDLLNNIREDVFAMTNETHSGAADSWGALTAVVLGGGALGYAALGSAGGVIYLLVPLLVGLGLTLLFVVLVFAARQAIIIILVIVAPLAFVAYLLPNTEKWFEKWRDLFMTMLIFFPAFSLVFGGSQLAGQVIIQNAGDDLVLLLFGMAVQIAPLVITPLLLKLSGGLLGRIAQIANDPRKGYLDKARNWADTRIDRKRQQNLAKPTPFKKNYYKPWKYGRMGLQAMDNSNRNVQGDTDLAKLQSDNRYHQTKRYERLHESMYGAEKEKEIIETGHKTHVQDRVNTFGSDLYNQNAKLEAGKRALERSVKITESDVKEFENGKVRDLSGNYVDASSGTINAELAASIKRIKADKRATSIEGLRGAKADEALQRDLAEALNSSLDLRTRAGGIRGAEGIDSVLAAAKVAVQKANAEDIKNIQDAAGLKPGDMQGAADAMVEAIRAGNSVRARAFQNMLVSAGGAGIEKFRDTMEPLGAMIPADVAEDMRDNLLSNHGAAKAKASDIIDWAAKGGTLASHTNNSASWAGMADKDFIGQHPKTQMRALATHPFTRQRAQSILAADVVEGNVLTEDVKRILRNI